MYATDRERDIRQTSDIQTGVRQKHRLMPRLLGAGHTICNPNPSHNRNPTVITDPQMGPRDPQIVTVLIRPVDLLRFAFCRVPKIYVT